MKGLCDKVRGDGDDRAVRGMGCLLTGVELFPGNIQGGSDTPAGVGQWEVDQSRRLPTSFRRRKKPARGFGSTEFGVMVPDSTTLDSMSYAVPNKPIAPIDDPYQMFKKLYGQVKDREVLTTSWTVQDDLQANQQCCFCRSSLD